jgi:hypothetical protein
VLLVATPHQIEDVRGISGAVMDPGFSKFFPGGSEQLCKRDIVKCHLLEEALLARRQLEAWRLAPSATANCAGEDGYVHGTGTFREKARA